MRKFILYLALAFLVGNCCQARAQQALLDFLKNLKVGKPLSYQNLTIYPLASDRTDKSWDILSLDQAAGQGVLKITELGSGEVNRIVVENRSLKYVFLMAGELMAGCKQDRMVAEDCLLPPLSGRTEISVYCTEHGRWTEQSRDFHSLGSSAHVRMRQVAQETKSQQEVWDAVREKSACLSVPLAATEDLKSVIGHQEVENKVKPYHEQLTDLPKLGHNIVGVAAVYRDEVICIDLFSQPALFRALWPKLLRSYALDVIDRPRAECRLSRTEVEDILSRIFEADFEKGRTDGVGQAWNFSARRLSGSALLYRNQVIHSDIFPKREGPKNDGETPRLDYRRNKNYRSERRN